GCEAGEYTSFTGAHTLVVPRNLATNAIDINSLALPDATRRFDKRTHYYEYDSSPMAHLELNPLSVRCTPAVFSR
ncbi:unnamed protein product, partial [Amoebophrya sp. A25]